MLDLFTDLAFIWAGLIAFAVLAYVLFDGFDLGIGILFPFLADDHERDQAMNSVAPVWDGNETWLILGGGGLMAAFPLAYAVVMPALYAPITAMLLGLIFRGVAFEFRWRTVRGKFLWDWSFALGSLVAAIAQGIALGALIQGIPVSGRAYAGGWWNWLTWFSLLTGFALVVGFALLGATWLILKTSGELQERARRFAWITGLGTLALIGLVSLITPFLDPIFMQRWFAWPAIVYVGAGADLRGAGGRWRCSGASIGAARPCRSWQPSRCSCCRTSASASASIPTSCRPRSRSGMQPHPTTASSSCWSARRC